MGLYTLFFSLGFIFGVINVNACVTMTSHDTYTVDASGCIDE